jgi:hypothetical protein
MEGEGRRRRPYAFLTVAVRLSSARASRLLWYCSTGGGGGLCVCEWRWGEQVVEVYE